MQDRYSYPYGPMMGPGAQPAPDSDQNSLRQPAVMMQLCTIGAFMIFGNSIALQVMLDYFSFDYGLNDSARSLFMSTAYAAMLVGQLIVALLCDRYFGVIRSLRLGLCLSLGALLGLVVFAGNGAPRFYYAGQGYEVGNIDTATEYMQYVKIGGEAINYSIGNDGSFQFETKPKNDIPQRIAPEHWDMDMGEGTTNKILLLLPMALLIIGRCFGVPVVFSALGACYGERHRARMLGFFIMMLVLNLGYGLMQLVQLYLEPLLGRKAILGLAASLMFVGYLRARFDRAISRSPMAYKKSAPASLRNRAYLLLGLGMAMVALLMLGTLLNAVPLGAAHRDSVRLFAPSEDFLNRFMVGLLIAGTAVGLVYSRFYEKASQFYACLAILLASIIYVFFWTFINLGAEDFTSLSLAHVDLAFFQTWQAYALNVSLFNPAVIIIFGGIFAVLWLQIGARLPTVSAVNQSIIAFILVGVSYYLLSIGAHIVGPDGKMAWPFYIFALFALPLSEICIGPALYAAVYRLRHDKATTALAYLIFSGGYASVLIEYTAPGMNWITTFGGDHAHENPTIKAMAGDHFLGLGSSTILLCVIIMLVIRPLFLKAQQASLAAASGESQAKTEASKG